MDQEFDDDARVIDTTPAEEAELRDLESRISKLREPEGGGNTTFARGVSLVASMGFVLAGCLFAGLYLGDYLVLKFGMSWLRLAGLGLGLVTALFAVVKLMRPFLQAQD